MKNKSPEIESTTELQSSYMPEKTRQNIDATREKREKNHEWMEESNGRTEVVPETIERKQQSMLHSRFYIWPKNKSQQIKSNPNQDKVGSLSAKERK